MFSTLVSFGLSAAIAGFAPDFGPPVTYPDFPTQFVVGDFNGDGRPDVAGSNGAAILTMLNTGNGSFQPPIASPLTEAGSAVKMTVGDFNGDGIADLLHGSVYAGTGDGTFVRLNVTDAATYDGPLSGDFNGDGFSDLVHYWTQLVGAGEGWAEYAHYVVVYLNDGTGRFGYSSGYWWCNDGSSEWYVPAVADFNRDGISDIAFRGVDPNEGAFGWNTYCVFWLGAGNGQFQLADTAGWQFGAVAVAGDFNRDGAVDVVAGGAVVLGNGNGTFEPQPWHVGYPIGAADFNGDGVSDVFHWNWGNPILNINLGVGNGAFGSSRSVSEAFTAPPVAADFNGDGLADFVGVTSPGLTLLFNDGVWITPQPTISVFGHSMAEYDWVATGARPVIALSHPHPQPVTVEYATVPGTATAGSDYQSASGTVTFAPGETFKGVAITIINDTLTEPDESFTVKLSNPVNGVLEAGEATCEILNDDFSPTISINNYSAKEGASGNKKFQFTVSLSSPSNQSVSVSYRTADGTATVADRDYNGANGSLTFSPGQTSKTITVTVRGDRKRESNEVFYVDLSGASNATIGESRGVGTIVNDD